MTMRTFTWLQCFCGHRGAIVESENDQPYSKEWSRTSLRDLESGGTYHGPYALISEIRPSCPKCKATLTPDNIINL